MKVSSGSGTLDWVLDTWLVELVKWTGLRYLVILFLVS
jgi:hypothetical protein